MNIERRQKYKGSHKIANTSRKIDVQFDLTTLNLMCSYVISENRNIRRSHLINLRNLFEIMDMGVFQNDIEKMKRIDFIKKGLEARLVSNLKNKDIILKFINGSLIDDDVIDPKNFNTLSNEELTWMDTTVSECLKYSFIYNDVDKMIDICTRFKAADYRNRASIVAEFETFVTEIQTKFRRVKAESIQETSFTLKDGMYDELMSDIYDNLTNPSNILTSGMQGMNELLGGGFFSGRVYMLLGLTGVGKSLTLLNLAAQIKKYNKNYIPKDPTKRPAILYMTMENTVKETVDRLFTIATGKNMTDVSKEDAIRMLKEDGELYLTDDSPVDILIKFVPDRSVDTGYLYTMVEDYEDEGYEIICLIQDHIKRIRSCYPQPDIRLELGAVVNEFKTFSAIKDIPVITNSHLNRDAARTVDEGARASKADLTRMLGRANIGESMLMLDNLDCSFIINVEYDAQGRKYMAFKRIKIRYKASSRDYICQPFEELNEIKLVDDFSLPVPVFRESLQPTPDEVELYNTGMPKNKSKYQNNVKDLDDILGTPIEEENLFQSSRYTMSNSSNEEEQDMSAIPMAVGIRSEAVIAPPTCKLGNVIPLRKVIQRTRPRR